jgi:hypothetical protein
MAFNEENGPPEGQGRWRRGDAVKVVDHREKHLIGHIFVVDEFSCMDYCEDHPRIKNPYPGTIGPIYTSFDPYDLTKASLLEWMAIL